MHVCEVEGCGKCFHRGEHLKRHIRCIRCHEKRECRRLFLLCLGPSSRFSTWLSRRSLSSGLRRMTLPVPRRDARCVSCTPIVCQPETLEFFLMFIRTFVVLEIHTHSILATRGTRRRACRLDAPRLHVLTLSLCRCHCVQPFIVDWSLKERVWTFILSFGVTYSKRSHGVSGSGGGRGAGGFAAR
ncbi:hypothetical protein C8R46DRAFT_649288 [Mycena filopes]|nr:hypothetical protein C8R46DRAFT_649288 [Mycena filopes]